MKKTLFAAVAMLAFVAPALARDDLICTITDTQGSTLIYGFADNTKNIDGSFGGTMVETGFDKDGKTVISKVGNRPIWVYGGNRSGGFNLYSREAPGWQISVTDLNDATLTHNGRFAGGGSCDTTEAATATNEYTVGDQGE